MKCWPRTLLSLLGCFVVSSAAFAQGYSPQEALSHMTVADGLKVSLFASEPQVRQPIFVKCDDRGRLWTIQYLQYPNPAGLERVKIDRWSRTVYDRVPAPPPRGPRGADRITILEDTDGDGSADRAKDFLDGLNLVTGVEFGHGGVFVLNVPYLLFYPDRDRDDVPDGNPEVLLTGLGMEDAQAMSNHLTWGPDGWLYGVNGSTTTCRIRGIEFQQGVWRYHPITREFELFCEGGSNCYGVTFDVNGELYYSTNGGPFVHAVQGGYFYKSFGKHGPLHNLYTYHFFPELERDQVPGGPPTGGTVYLADAFPKQFDGTFIAGNFLGHTVSWWTIQPTATTVRATYGGVLLDSHDTWFGPTDVCLGPDGAIYVSDFYDQRTAHPDPDANWDRTNGRIYKIAAATSQAKPHIDIAKLSSEKFVELLSHPNQWYRNRARMELAARRDPLIVTRLRELATQSGNGPLALEGLWALNVTTCIDNELALKLLDHPYPYVRSWMVRLIGDSNTASPEIAHRLVALASNEPSALVCSQLAATAKRLPGKPCLQIVDALLRARPDESDSRIPWLIWWAIESKATSDTDLMIKTFANDAMWSNPAARDNLLRLIRRFAAEGTAAGYAACLQVLKSTPPEHLTAAHENLRLGLAERAVGLAGIGQGDLYNEQAASAAHADAASRRYEPLTGELQQYVAALWRQSPRDVLRMELALRAGVDDAYPALVAAAFDEKSSAEQAVPLLQLLREFGQPDVAPKLLDLVTSDQPDAVKLSALEVLAKHDAPGTAETLLAAYPKMPSMIQSPSRDVLFARPATVLLFLHAVDAGQIAEDVPVDQLRRLALHNDEEINRLVRKHWGNIGPGSVEEKLATMRRYNNDLRPEGGERVHGEQVFDKQCGVCHQLYGRGNKIGPDLTSANRADRAALLANIVDPSAVIRREYLNYIVTTKSGRLLTGLLAEQDAAAITILDANNQRIKIARDEVDEVEETDVSLMPERILDALTPQEIRDLFAYLQHTPVTSAGAQE